MTTPQPEISLHEQVCVVTGANSGIGLAAAKELARLGATVVLVCRDQTRGRGALAEVAATATGGAPRLELADLSALTQVRDLAERLNREDRIDVLVNNAGLIVPERILTADGLEYTFALNHLAPFLLTNLLLDKLTASAPARVVTVSSELHGQAKLDLADPQLEQGYRASLAYSNSKLANILFTRELAHRLRGTGVTANCLHPGLVRTGFGGEMRGAFGVALKLARWMFLTPERGADTVVYLASSPEVAEVTGEYFVKRQQKRSSKESYDADTAAALWQLSATLTGLEPAST